MNSKSFLTAILSQPLLIHENAFVCWAAKVASLEIQGPVARASDTNFFGDPIPKMRISGETAIVPISGVMLANAGFLEKGFGAVSHQDIARDLDTAASNPTVKQIVLVADSPGGSFAATPELAAKVSAINAQKPVYAFTDSVMASACYFACAGCTAIYATPSASVGSIGVRQELVSFSRALAAMGIDTTLIVSGQFKAAGHPSQALSDTDKEYFQSGVDQAFGMFKSHVQANRPRVSEASMQGQVFFGQEALNLGLVDGLASSIQEVLGDGKPKAGGIRASVESAIPEGQRAFEAVFDPKAANRRSLVAQFQNETDQAKRARLFEEWRSCK